MRFMFDTNVLNEIIKKAINPLSFDRKHKYFITPVQYSEILQTKNLSVRKNLVAGFEVIKDIAPMGLVHIHTAPFGHFPFGHGPFGGGDGKYYAEVLKRLSKCHSKSRRGDGFDALIIETCKMEAMTLVTEDSGVQKVCAGMEVNWVNLRNFLIQVVCTGLLEDTAT